ncbi:hypothetical protein [Streptomyces sp. NPDC002526]
MPSLPPPRTTELYYDGAWHNISGDMQESASVRITRGVTGLGARQDPTAASCTLDNRSGAYSPRNPLSSLFGKIGRNTPWRFGVDAGNLRLDLPSSAYTLSTPDAAALDIPGDLDVRIDVAPTTWTSGQMLVNRYFPGNLAFSFMLTPAGHLLLNWSATGLSAGTYAVSTVPVPAGHRLRLRTTLDVDNGASGRTVAFYVASGDGGWAQLGDPVVQSGTTSLYAGTAPLHIGDPVAIAVTPEGDPLGRLVGRVYGVQVYAGINGDLRVDVRPEDQAAAGDTTFTDGAGLVWTLGGAAALSRHHTRMVGEVPAWPPSRDLSGAARTVQIAPAGIMRRLGAGNRPLDSALRRFILGNNPHECWPLTDGEQATQGASLLGSPPAQFVGDLAPHWGKGSLASWVEPVLLTDEEATGQILARLAAPGTAAWSVDWVFSGTVTAQFPSIRDNGNGSDEAPQMTWNMLLLTGANTLTLSRTVATTDASSSATLTTASVPQLFDGGTHHVRLRTVPGSTTTTWSLYIDGVAVQVGSVAGVGRPLKEVSYAWGFGNTAAIGYITCWNSSAPAPVNVIEALRGFPGETAGARALRISAENGVPASLAGATAETELLGVQEPQRYLETLDTIAAADLGLMLEQRDDLALIYRPRATLYNQIPALELDFSAGEISAPFAPIDDDRLTENDITVKRKGGSAAAAAVREDGPLGVDTIGRYDVAHELSLATDEQATQQAWWRLHVGTHDGLRYTKITVNLANARAAAKADAALAVDVGDLIRLQNLPADQRAGDVDLIVTGYEEEVGATAWTITYTCVPGEPWAVAVVNDTAPGRADTAGSQLAAAATASATTLSIATTAGPVWTTDQREYPFDLTVDGEAVTAVSAGLALTPNPLLRDDASGWEPLSAVLSRSTDVVHSAAGGRASLLMTPTGASSASATTTPHSPVGSITPGASYIICGWVYSPAGWSDMRIVADWHDASDGFLSTSPSVAVPAPAGVWTWISVTATAPAGSSRARVRARIGANPGVGDLSYWWGVRLVAAASVSTSSPQTMTVIRSVTGIVKAQAAGADVRLTHPMIIAL